MNSNSVPTTKKIKDIGIWVSFDPIGSPDHHAGDFTVDFFHEEGFSASRTYGTGLSAPMLSQIFRDFGNSLPIITKAENGMLLMQHEQTLQDVATQLGLENPKQFAKDIHAVAMEQYQLKQTRRKRLETKNVRLSTDLRESNPPYQIVKVNLEDKRNPYVLQRIENHRRSNLAGR
jgi:hypothetical protein